MTHVMETGTVPTWHSRGMGSLHSHHMRRLILAGHRGSNGSGHPNAGSYMFHSTLPHLKGMMYRDGRPTPAHVYAYDTRTTRRPFHKLSFH